MSDQRSGDSHIDYRGASFGNARGNFGVGGSYVEHHSSGDQLVADIDRLLQVIERHQAEIEDRQTAVESAQALRSHVTESEPKSGVVKSLLAGILTAAPGVAAVAEAVAKVRAAFG